MLWSRTRAGGSRLAGYLICTALALLALTFVLAVSTPITLLFGAILMLVVLTIIATLRNRKR